MKRLTTVFIGIVLASFSYSQNETDALRYSYLNYNGTARFAGLGGAMGALGADMSAVTLNPAGMGRYSRSDFSFTGDVTFARNSALYNTTASDASKGNFNISNLGIVFVKPIDFEKPTMWRYFQFGVTSSRTNDFHGRTSINGNHDNSWLLSSSNYLNSNGISLEETSDFYEYKAWQTYLLDYDTLSQQFAPWYDTNNANIDQSKTIITRGAQYQTDITFSGNYDGKLLVGGSFGFPRIRYSSTSTYKEVFNNPDSILDTESFTMDEELRTEGSGFNMKLGVIYLPVKFVRLGLALHTPTWYSMNDQYSTTFASDFIDDEYNRRESSPQGSFDYRLKTPGRVLASAAFLYKKRGFISFEYEFVDYGNARFNRAFNGNGDVTFKDVNDLNGDIYQGASIYKAGAEFRVTNHWTIRGGYTFYESPFKKDVTLTDGSRTNVSGGMGYRNQNFSLDFTYLQSRIKTDNYLYDPAYVNAAQVTQKINNFMVTAGFRF